MTHEERARNWCESRGLEGDVESAASLAAQFAEVERKALERAARECLLHRTAEVMWSPPTGAFNRGLKKAHDAILALTVTP